MLKKISVFVRILIIVALLRELGVVMNHYEPYPTITYNLYSPDCK